MQGARGKVTQGESGCPPAPGSFPRVCGAGLDESQRPPSFDDSEPSWLRAQQWPSRLLPFLVRRHRAGCLVHPRAVRARGRGRSGRAGARQPPPARARRRAGRARRRRRWPSVEWRRQWSLLLGLDRLLSQDEPVLADGTVLSAHQVDALSGTLTALLADALRNGTITADEEVVAEAPARPARRGGAAGRAARGRRRARGRGAARLGGRGRGRRGGRRRRSARCTRTRTPPSASGSSTPPAPASPSRRSASWRPRAPAGSLILTHRRNLVDQFLGELRDRGYQDRISPPLLGDQDAPTARSRSRPTSGSSATPATSRTPTRSSSATRPTPRWARRPRRRSAAGAGRSSSA